MNIGTESPQLFRFLLTHSVVRSFDPPANMKRLFQTLAVLIGIWVLGSFVGVMFDPLHKNMWTQSLMWALLSCVILAPVFIFVGTSPESSSTASRPAQAEQSFEVDEQIDVSQQEEPSKKEGWPYTSS